MRLSTNAREACSDQRAETTCALVRWSDFVHDRTKKVPFLIRPDVLRRDEAIVAVFTHEMDELRNLRQMLRHAPMTIEECIAPVAPGVGGNLHDNAWDEAGVQPMTVQQLVHLFERGAIVKNHLLYATHDQVNPADPDATLGLLPPPLYEELNTLLNEWTPGAMRSTHGPVAPPEKNIQATREWLRARQRLGAG